MRVSFATKRLEKEMGSATAIQRRYGDLAKRIKMRLDILYQADSLADVPQAPPTRRHQLADSGGYVGCFAVDVSGNWRLVFRPDHDPVPSTEDGGINLLAIKAIIIIAIVDYH